MTDVAVHETYGETLRRVLDGRPLTWLAERTGVGQSRLERLAKGRAIPRLDETALFARTLGVSVDEFVPQPIPTTTTEE